MSLDPIDIVADGNRHLHAQAEALMSHNFVKPIERLFSELGMTRLIARQLAEYAVALEAEEKGIPDTKENIRVMSDILIASVRDVLARLITEAVLDALDDE